MDSRGGERKREIGGIGREREGGKEGKRVVKKRVGEGGEREIGGERKG